MRSRKLLVSAILVIALIVLLGIVVAAYAYQKYTIASAALRRAQEHAKNAETILRDLAQNPAGFDQTRIETLVVETTGARQELTTVLSEAKALDPLLKTSAFLPIIGNNARALHHLIRMADGAMLGSEVVPRAIGAALMAAYEPDEHQGGERLVRAMQAGYPILEFASAASKTAQEEYWQIPKDGLFPPLASVVHLIGERLPGISNAVLDAKEAAGALLQILGADGERVYLVLVQDTGEIRPTGGFIGNYGIVKVSNGHIVEQKFADTYSLDLPYHNSGKASPPVEMFARYLPEATAWALRDSNLWPDFPTSAKQARKFALDEGAADRIDGVIAITPALARQMLRATGPIVVPGFGDVANEQNFEDLIRLHQNSQPPAELREILGDDFVANRKLFTSLLIKTMVQQLTTLDIQAASLLIPSIQEAARQKDILVYFENEHLQRVIERHNLDGSVKATPGDYLWIVDMNLSANKDNLSIKQKAQYDVTVTEDKQVFGELTIEYDYSKTDSPYTWSFLRDHYADYLRIYVPPGTVLLDSNGTDEQTKTIGQHGKTVFETFLKIYPGTIRTIRFRYQIPIKFWPQDRESHYELLVQKQPATNIDSLNINVSFPSNAVVTKKQGFEGQDTTLHYSGGLPTDLEFFADVRLP